MMVNKAYIKLLGTISLSIGLVVMVFLISEKQVHRNNAFMRRLPPHAITKKFDLNLGFNSYYIAGFHQNKMYLGNGTAPFHLLRIDLKSLDTTHIRIHIKDKNIRFQHLEINILPPYFYLLDGTVPTILRGKLGKWNAQELSINHAYFDKAVPMDDNQLVFRTVDANTLTSTLGYIRLDTVGPITLRPSILEKQMDGIFDVDGVLARSPNHNFLVYTYFYRNEFMVLDAELKVLKRQKTLDTVHIAQIKVDTILNRRVSEMRAPPLIINNSSSLDEKLVYCISNRLGKYEDDSVLEQASILDVYNWRKGTYEYSAYIHKSQNEKIREIKIIGKSLYVLVGNRLSFYDIHR